MEIKKFLHNIIMYSASYAKQAGPEQFKAYARKQNPRATIILCADSRVQLSKIIDFDVDDFFVIRNIGNQIDTAPGSVEYGIEYVKTPVVIVLGHSGCGAIIAALADTRSLSPFIRHEIETISIDNRLLLNENIIFNVHNQVYRLMKEYRTKIDSGELLVIGAVYDFADDFGKGYGALIFIDVNGETDPEKIKKHHYFQEESLIGME